MRRGTVRGYGHGWMGGWCKGRVSREWMGMWVGVGKGTPAYQWVSPYVVHPYVRCAHSCLALSCLVCRYWSKLACDKRLCFAALNNVLQDTVEVTPEIDSSLSSAML
jgi:hypothetical protein